MEAENNLLVSKTEQYPKKDKKPPSRMIRSYCSRDLAKLARESEMKNTSEKIEKVNKKNSTV